MGDAICSVDECNSPHESRGLCNMHYKRWRRHGDVNVKLVGPRPTPYGPRFWAKVDAEGDCWLWTGVLHAKGYGHFKIGQRNQQVHRIAYELLVGPIPEGLQLDHLCRVRRCVNPDHLEPVTAAENLRRASAQRSEVNRRKTHCKRGHPFDEANTYRRVNRSGRVSRRCRACSAEEARQARARKEVCDASRATPMCSLQQ